MNIQGKAFHLLRDGHVICSVSHPEIYTWLVEGEGVEAMADMLEMLGMKLAVASGGKALYLAWVDGSPEALKAIKSQAKPLQEELSRIAAFVSFMLEIDDVSGTVSIGRIIRAGDISKAIDKSASLRESLSNTANALAVKGVTDLTKIAGILAKMRDSGHLVVLNSQREEYEVTGKIALYYDALDHFQTHIARVAMAVDQAEQGSFFNDGA
jgi:hypothetical protein